MKKSSVFYLFVLLIGLNTSLCAQDSIPRIIIGDISIYESADSIVGDGIQGYVSYDALTNTLYLNNATVPYLWAYRTEGYFKVRLSGDNFINKMMSSNDSCTFFGPGSLTLGGSSIEIALDCAHTDFLALTEGATVNITASEAGLFTLYDGSMDPDPILHIPNLVVDNSSLIVTAPLCFEFISDLWLSGCYMVEPSNFEYQLDTWLDLSSQVFQNYLEIRAGTVDVPSHTVSDWQAWGANGGIRMEQLPDSQTVEVLNLLGQTVRQFKTSATNVFVPLKAGVYLVRVNNQTVKVVVK